MRSFGAGLAMMTGSGAAVYGLFKDPENARACYKELSSQFDELFLTEPVPAGITEDK